MSDKMADVTLETLPTEILIQVFADLPTVSSVIDLSSTSRRFRSIYKSSKKHAILYQAAEAEFGPLEYMCQLITHNDSQPAHVKRSVNTSDALMLQIVRIGRVAQRWTAVYPLYKWSDTFEDRRLLDESENFALRRAIYRLWLFDKAFHTPNHCHFYNRMWPPHMHERTLLLHNFNSLQLAEMLDVHLMLRDFIAYELCPSDMTIRFRQQEKLGNVNYSTRKHADVQLAYGLLGYGPDLKQQSQKCFASMSPFTVHEQGGWGDEVRHYYVVEDMMKLTPDQLLLLHSWRHSPWQVAAHLSQLGEWFNNNGEVFSETLGYVLVQRGSDLEELKIAVRAEEVGVVSEQHRV